MRLRAAEFFAGIGLVREALERAGWEVAFANDIEPFKHKLYEANFGAGEFVLGDIRQVRGCDIPDIELATASFPCTDLSLAGWRRGLAGEQSGMLWEFLRVLDEMGGRRPPTVLLENVPSFGTSRGGGDLQSAISVLNRLGYTCDLFTVDARHFVPQSRRRLFVVGAREASASGGAWDPSELRPSWIQRFVRSAPELQLSPAPLALPPSRRSALADVVERIPPGDERWWDAERVRAFVSSLSTVQAARLDDLQRSGEPVWATAFRRTRQGKSVWEIRADGISGCLRATRGGSSKQAVVEARTGDVRVRWMTAREYARLQGSPDYLIPDSVSENQARFGFGDAVCVPVVEWIAREYLTPLAQGCMPAGGQLVLGLGELAVAKQV